MVEVEYNVDDPGLTGTTTKLALTYGGANAKWSDSLLIPFSSIETVYWRFVATDGDTPTANTTVSTPIFSFDTTVGCP